MLGEAVVHKEGTGAAVNVGPGVLDLACSGKQVGNHLIVSLNQVNEVVVLNVLISKLELEDETGVGLTEDGVTVSGDNLARFKGVGDVGLNIFLGPVLTELSLKVQDEAKALLVGESVEGASETVHTGSEGKVGVSEGRSNQMGSVSRNITTLVVTKIMAKKLM